MTSLARGTSVGPRGSLRAQAGAGHDGEGIIATQIRPFAPADGEALVRLSLSAWAPVFPSFQRVLGPAIYDHLYPDWQTQQRAVVEKAFGEGASTTVLVAEVDGIFVGFVAYLLNDEEKTGEVDLLAVHPDYQRRGVGNVLNEAALAKMREGGMALAVVATGGDEGHAPARRAYEKAGYTALPLVRYYQHLGAFAEKTADPPAGGDA